MAPTKKIDFAKSLQRIESILSSLEKEGVQDLEKSIKDVEEGLGLILSCRTYLSTMTNKVEVIKKQFLQETQGTLPLEE